jgi:hypothetical protein
MRLKYNLHVSRRVLNVTLFQGTERGKSLLFHIKDEINIWEKMFQRKKFANINATVISAQQPKHTDTQNKPKLSYTK